MEKVIGKSQTNSYGSSRTGCWWVWRGGNCPAAGLEG